MHPHIPTSSAVVVAAQWPDLSGEVPQVDVADPAFVRAAGHFGRRLPPAVFEALVDFADESPDCGALLLKGVPVGHVPPTPFLSLDTPVGKDRTSEFALLSVARVLGQPAGYLPESGGAIVQNIAPIRSTEDHQVATSSRIDLVLHTEGSYVPHKPRYVLLLCLRSHPLAATTLATTADILEHLRTHSPSTIDVLWQPRFRMLVDETYLDGESSPLSAPLAVLRGDPRRPIIVFDADLMRGTDDEAERALATLSDAVGAVRTGIVLEPGDLVVVDNHRTTHGRSAFDARYDGSDRWLQRCFVLADLSLSDGERDGRVLTAAFGQ